MKKLMMACVLLAACGKGGSNNGSCEWTWLESSSDGSIVKDTENCAPGWVESKCTAEGTGSTAAGVPSGKYVFSAGKSCEDRGFTACDKSRNMDFRKQCPTN